MALLVAQVPCVFAVRPMGKQYIGFRGAAEKFEDRAFHLFVRKGFLVGTVIEIGHVSLGIQMPQESPELWAAILIRGPA
jgi:hypothetical protein